MQDQGQLEQGFLFESQNMIDSLAAVLPVGVFYTDVLGNCLYVNARWCQISGLSATEALGYGWIEGIHPSDRDLVSKEWEKAVAANRPFSLEYRFLRKDGKTTWVYGQSSDLHDAGNNIIGYVGSITDINDRKQAEQRLQESEERLRMALQASNQGLYDLNLQTGEAIVSPEYAIMLGYDPDSFQENYEHWLERMHPDDREVVAKIYQHYIAQQIPEYKVEFRLRAKDGSYKWLLSIGKIVAWDDNHNPLRMIGTHTDISDRKQAEAERLKSEKLRQELKLLEKILEIILAGYWDWDIPNDYEYLSTGFKRMFGYKNDELPNSPSSWQNIIFPEDLHKVVDCFEQHILSHGHTPFYNEVRYRHKNGSTVWVICSGQVIEWSLDGKPLRMIGCHIDISKLKQAEEKLKRSDAHLKSAQRIGKLGSWEFELSSQTVIWSDEVFRIFGRDPKLGAPTFEDLQNLIHPDDRDYHQEILQYAIANANPYDIELRVYPPDGTQVYVEAKAEPVLDANGNLERLVGTVLDITDRKQAERKLLQITSQLEASNRELEAFAYSVSHDLRAPLRAISGFSQALIEDYGKQLGDEAKDYFERIQNNVNRMGRLIDDLLSLSKVSQFEITYTSINLSKLVKQQAQELQMIEPERSVEFVIAEDVIVQADLVLAGVVISNLLQNAWKFTSHHAISRIEFGVLKEKGETIYFIKDDGAGFDMKYANKLFGVFQRLHDTVEFPGTGIGLATVQRVIQRHGGKIWAESAIEQGATFYFTFHDCQ